jgi:glucose/arabinose dehydrogenase
MIPAAFQWPRRAARVAALCASVWALAGCSESSFDSASQIGPNPNLPEPQQYLLPPMHVASVVGWKNDEKPTVALGLKVGALAKGLEHPRSIYVLPNGDILIVESKAPETQVVRRPKDLVMHWVESEATSGGGDQKSNRITLFRNANEEAGPETRGVFLDNLNSPFGVALVGNELYVANTDAIVRYSYNLGDAKISDKGTVLTPLPRLRTAIPAARSRMSSPAFSIPPAMRAAGRLASHLTLLADS